ncbi:cytoplasmic dynein 2 light intermediate chain 1 [Condylostylus longicornis]|uniref:cytoplasmic dynein 2 light intermediate chain 1 n=1 Tax=Condylostylus longicornis TaxID=2530218 RepID=UPI00244E413A|nr:cytoplasmic dynein 2 light intermediate chain 1 [Condylostylus longicornis]
MLDSLEKPSLDRPETIQDIAIKLVEEQLRIFQLENGPKERTVFILGSKGVGKSGIINKFFDREENSRPTLALEYSFGRRSQLPQDLHKQILNVWELGSLENSNQLIEVPMRSHGLTNFSVIIMLDLSQTNRIWTDLSSALQGLRSAYNRLANGSEVIQHREQSEERVKKTHPDLGTMDLFWFPLVIIGGKYDIFQNFDPEIKKHVCRCLRSISHSLGAALVFYSNEIPKLSKTVRDTISHLGFGSPTNPFRSHSYDYNEPLMIWFGQDSWDKIGTTPGNFETIGINFETHIPQVQPTKSILPDDPTFDPGFKETAIDEMRAQKDEELLLIMKQGDIRGKFETIKT